MIERTKFASPLCILLTSTIMPSGASSEKIQERRQQYEEALKSWMLHPDPRISGIVYCDNSSPDLEWAYELATQQGCTKDFEAIYCPDNDIPNGMHYGYPELGIIDYSIQKSRLINQSAYFVKVTGRLQFPKFSALLDTLPASFDAAIDYRSAYKHDRKSWSKYRARTQIMFFKKNFYIERLMEKKSLMIEDGISHIEEFIAGVLIPNEEKNSNIVFRWPIECPPSGFGGNGDNFDSRKRRLKVLASHCTRRVLPWLWI
ncbi:MAG: hypothetical protein WCS87_10490 [Methylococcaceae bacterium]